MKRLLMTHLRWLIHGMRVYALIGESGSGKSFRAALIMERYNIDLVVDDGLIIRNAKIIGGRSAKREDNYLAAVRVAIFADARHREEALRVLKHERFQSVLLLGTSERMVRKIAQSLRLPPPKKIIDIEHVASKREIEDAMHQRTVHGSHVLPVPVLEVRRNHPQMVAESLQVILRRGFGLLRGTKSFEKSLVRPQYSMRGTIQISEQALGQLIIHCLAESGVHCTIHKILIKKDQTGYEIEIFVGVDYVKNVIDQLAELQTYTVSHIERFTGIIIKKLNIIIDKLSAERI